MKKSILAFVLVVVIALGAALAFTACNNEFGGANFEIAFDLQEEWRNAFDTNYPQVALLVRAELAQSDPALVAAVAAAFEQSAQFARQNPAEAARIVGPQVMNSAYLPAPSVVESFIQTRGQYVFDFVHAQQSRAAVTGFLQTLHGVNPQSVGGSVPGENFFFSGDGSGGSAGTGTISVLVPDGAPLIAAAYLFYTQPQIAGRNVTYELTTGPLIASRLLATHRPDFALAPINLAAVNFNNTGNYILAGIALWGLLHIVENTALTGGTQSLADLVGETIFAYQPDMSPGVVLESILINAGLTVNVITVGEAPRADAVNIVYLFDNSAARDALLGHIAAIGQARFALIAEPVATALTLLPPTPASS